MRPSPEMRKPLNEFTRNAIRILSDHNLRAPNAQRAYGLSVFAFDTKTTRLINRNLDSRICFSMCDTNTPIVIIPGLLLFFTVFSISPSSFSLGTQPVRKLKKRTNNHLFVTFRHDVIQFLNDSGREATNSFRRRIVRVSPESNTIAQNVVSL